MTVNPVRVAVVGIGWWSNILAEGVLRTSGALQIDSCYSRSTDKRSSFADKYECKAANSYQEILEDETIEGIINLSLIHISEPTRPY